MGIDDIVEEEYDERFSEDTVRYLIQAGIPAKVANAHDARFSYSDLLFLVKENMLPEISAGYPDPLGGVAITKLWALGITPEIYAALAKDRELTSLLSQISLSDSIEETMKGMRLLSFGAQSIVLSRLGDLWKISVHIREEYELLKRIVEPVNVVRPMGKPTQFTVEFSGTYYSAERMLKLEWIPGKSLASLLVIRGFTSEKVVQYCGDILNGLIELRQAGIWYHRDIRPANIMIDEVNDRAVIIDLGIATTVKDDGPKDNMRYGCPGDHANDLVSLGQIMYKMATGEHLFKNSETMDRTTHFKINIRDERVKVYQDPEKNLLPYFQKIDKNVKDERVNALIKACLTAKHYQYRKMQRMFERYMRTVK